MSYDINFTETSKTPITVPDQDVEATSTSLTFVGKNYPGYSVPVGENFLHILENFASNTAPSNPVEGQLWYKTGEDTVPAQPKLMIYDGAKWTEASGIKKGTTQPAAEDSIVGDLWVDVANQQLYLYTGAVWVLVGPSYNQGSLSGIKAEEIIDRDTNTAKPVLICYITDSPVAIISKYDFYPKVAIAGFSRIREGINLTTLNFTTFDSASGEFVNKLWGTAEKSNALVVGNSTVPAANFLRSDTVSTTNYIINIRNGGGLSIGDGLETSLSSSSSGAILSHKISGSPIIFQTTSESGTKNVITILGEKVGINNAGPTEALDVVGNVVSSGSIKTTNTTDSTSTTTGSIVTAGGAGIAGALNVGSNASVSGNVTVGGATPGVALTPRSNENYDIGASGNKFNRTYSKEFIGTTFTGSFVGGLTGNVTGSATSLSNTAQFSIRGDVTSNVIPFNGAQPVPVRNIAFIARSSNVATITTSADHGYVSGYIALVTCSTNSSFDTTNNQGAVITVTGARTFTYSNTGSFVSLTPATGTVNVSPGGSFITSISESIIASKTEVTDSADTDYFLVYRAAATPALRKISKAVMFSTAGTVPTGSIFPYGGDTPPPGYLLCDGSEQSQTQYPQLFAILGYKYKSQSLLTGFNTFAVPDLRGRFPLGKEDMDNANSISIEISASSATRAAITALGAITTTFVVQNSLTTNGPFQVGKLLTNSTGNGGPGGLDITNGPVVITSIANNTPSSGYTTITVSMSPQTTTFPAVSGLIVKSIGSTDAGGGAPSPSRVPAATSLGNVGGSSQKTLSASNVPEHKHNLIGSAGNQYYAFRFAGGQPTDEGAIAANIHNTSNSSHLLPTTGSVAVPGGGSAGQPIDILNPYQTVNYIIFTGKIL